MKTALLYLLQVIISSGILYVYYHLLLRNKKFHQYNRYYLLMATFISICIPFLHIPVYFDAAESEPMLAKTLTVFSSDSFAEDAITVTATTDAGWVSAKNIISSPYLLIAVFLFTRFCVALIRIGRMLHIYPGEKIDNIRFYNTHDPSTPFSFFRWLFWNEKIDVNSDHGQQIFRHELYHIQQKHSRDTVFLELVTMIFWINPFFHLIKKEIKAIHEFLADKFAVEENKEWDYAELLLMQVLDSPNTRLTNPFFHNQIKRRITMLTNSQKPGYQYLRKIMVLPVAAIIIGLFAFTYKNRPAADKKLSLENPVTIVIDASHGGTDPGAISPDEKYTEAKLSLDLARLIKSLGNDYNVNVVITRDGDAFPGGALTKEDALKKRMEITQDVKAVAFVSLHLSSSSDNKFQEKSSGIEAYVSASKNSSLDKKLAAEILQNLGNVYKTDQQIKQRRSAGIYVLDKSECPAVLLELGFINNQKDLEFITSKDNQEKIARSILEAIVRYNTGTEDKAVIQANLDTVPAKTKKQPGEYGKKETISISADSIVWQSSPDKMKSSQDKTLIIVNGKRMDNNLVQNKNIVAKTITLYEKNDKKAIQLYGADAKNGVVVFEGATITDKENTDPVKKEDVNSIVFEQVEIDPAFPGGEKAWRKYLMENLNAMIPVDSGAPAGNYTVYVQFLVDNQGNISQVKPITKHGYGMENEVVRIIEKGPKWLAGIQNGKRVTAWRKQPVTFAIEEEKEVVGRPTDKIKTNNEIVVVGYPSKTLKEREIVENADINPKFPGGDIAWSKYLERNLNANVMTEQGAPAGIYRVVVIYVVNTDGSLSDIRALTNYGYGMEAEAIRLLKNSPNWMPAIHNGKKVNAYMKQPVTFQLADDKKTTR